MKPISNLRLLSLLCTLMILPLFTFSQTKERYPFNNVTKEELQMTTCSFDPDAPAMILGDKGNIRINEKANRFVLFERQIRIKIFKKEGMKFATFEIPLYVKDQGSEDIEEINGITYNLENGRIRETKLDNSSIFIEKTSKNWRTAKIALPNVREGSVIDLSFSVYSDFPYQITPWYFQDEIPTNWSEVVVNFTNRFNYSYNIQSLIPFAINAFASKNESEQYDLIKEYDGYVLAVSKAPAVKYDNYMTTPKDYEAQLKMELASYIREDGSPVKFTDSWATLISEMLDNMDFGKQLKRGSFLKDELQKFNKNNDEECIKAIYEYVRSKVKWDGNTSLFVKDNIEKVYERGNGSTAEINLLLLALLREAGYKADPMLVSTRSHGKIPGDYPILSNFNTVIAYLNLNGKTYLLDASNRFVAFNQLPEQCLNGKGRILNRDIPSGWIDLTRQERAATTASSNLTLDEKGVLKGSLQVAFEGITAADVRELANKKGIEEYFKSVKAENSNWTLDNLSFENLNNTDQRLVENSNISIGTPKDTINTLYVRIIPFVVHKENPFKKEDRKYPVEFATKGNETISTRIKLDPSYKIEEMPKSITYTLPNSDAVFRFSVTYEEETKSILVQSKLSINKLKFTPEEYKGLRELYNLISEKHNSMVVLKKIAATGSEVKGS